jgi:hypothetical protein
MGCIQSKDNLSIDNKIIKGTSYGSPKTPINEDPQSPNNTPISNIKEYSKPNLRIRIPNDRIINKINKLYNSDEESYSLLCKF